MIPLRMVSRCVSFCAPARLMQKLRAQIPWSEEFTHPAARELFGLNLLTLTWVAGEPLPDELVGDIVRGLGLECETLEEQRTRRALITRCLRPVPAEQSVRRGDVVAHDEAAADTSVLTSSSILANEFTGLVGLFVKERIRDLAVIKLMTQSWRHEMIDHNEEQEQLRL
jgi:hypothetical protein